MRDDVEICRVTAQDIDAVHRLETISFPSPWRREFFENELRGSGRFSLVARRRHKVVAYVFAMWFYDEMHVNKIAVEPSERRKGIALRLMNECIEFAQQHNVRTISLEVRQSNRGAQDFYKFLDFAPMYLRPRYYPDGEAAVVMTKRL